MVEKQIRTVDELVALVGVPLPRVANKVRPTLHELDRQWLAASPFCLVATADENGACDVSPKGDAPGHLAQVIDDTTIALAERPGNRRADGYRNVLANPHVGADLPDSGSRRYIAHQRPGAAGVRCAVLR